MFQHEEIIREEALNLLKSKTPETVLEYYNKPYIISQEQIDFYQKNGFVVLRNVLNGLPLNYARNVIRSAVFVRKDHDKRTFAEKSKYEQSFLQCGFLCWDYPVVKDFVFGKRFAGIAGDLMKEDGVRLWHDQALFKEPGGRNTPVHQDSSYWPVSQPQQTTTIWMALNNVNHDNGCLYFYPESHTWEKEYVDIFKNPHEPEQLKSKKKIYAPLAPGDVTIHSGLTFHGADDNKTNLIREGMTIIYISDGNKYDSSDERNSTHKSCDGLTDGQVIDTKYTPRLI